MAKKIVTGALNLSKTSYNYNNGTIPGCKGALSNNIPDLINELRYTNGQIGSVQITTAYTLNNERIATGWYNYIYIPHRTGGKDGDISGDNANFGTLLLTGMTLATQIYKIRLHNGSIAEMQVFARNNELANYLPLTGGTITGQIIGTSGSSWIKDRDAATVRNNNGTQDGSYKPIISQKTKDGNWTIGNLSGENNLTFNYTTDTNYNANTNQSSRWTLSNSGVFSGNATNVTQKTSASAKTHSNYGTNNGYLPDMSFIAYWNGAYSSGNASNLTYAHQGTIQCKPTVLYNNATGTKGTITLSQTVANFTFLSFYGYKQEASISNAKIYHGCTMYSPNGKYISVVNPHYASTVGIFQINWYTKYPNGTSITNINAGFMNFSNGGNEISSNNDFYITQVIGWK